MTGSLSAPSRPLGRNSSSSASEHQMSSMFDPPRLINACEPQTTPCFEGRCDFPPLLAMEHQIAATTTSHLSDSAGTASFATYERRFSSPPDFSPLSSSQLEEVFKGDDNLAFTAGLQHALSDPCPYPQELDKGSYQYVNIRDAQPPYFVNSQPLFYSQPAFPQYQQAVSYLGYSNYYFGHPEQDQMAAPTSPQMSQYSHPSVWPSPSSTTSFELNRGHSFTAALSPEEEEEDAGCDKPYARLIYEALMQAPGNKMMLREIYDWFQCNTSKPAESGTNGWQNSIRHNLSMNQAFENDKADMASPSGQKQKVNSVWVLTENAIKHGVQSTTRYRKTGSGKRMNTNKIPALQRQRSGAKGGKAARRAAQLRKKQHSLQNPQPSPLRFTHTPLYDYESSTYDGQDGDTYSVFDPATPVPDTSYHGMPSYLSSAYSPDVSAHFKTEDPFNDEIDCGMHDLCYPSNVDFSKEEMLRVHRESITSNAST